jgi:hypothetical protein
MRPLSILPRAGTVSGHRHVSLLSHLRDRLGPAGGWVALVVLAGLVGVAVAASGSALVGVAVGVVVLGVGVLAVDPLLLIVLPIPGSLLVMRVGGSSTNLSIADLLVFMGGVAALFFVEWSTAPALRRFMIGIVVYQAALLLVVLAHPNRYDIVDWFHRLSFTGGAVLVGWVVAANGRCRQAFRPYLVGATFLALVAIANTLIHHFQPAQFGQYQKNAIGDILWVAVVLAQVRPPWLGIGRREGRVYLIICLLGILSAQSRQAVISMLVALGIATLLNPVVRRQAKFMMLSALPLGVAVYYTIVNDARVNPKFNSVAIRLDQLSAAINAWHQSPVFGLGMRFYNLPDYLSITAPPNVLVDNLASTGIVGSIAFFFLVAVNLDTLARLPRIFGTLGLAVLAAHYVNGLFDIFWIGASSVAAFAIAGASLGTADAVRAGRLRVADEPPPPAPPTPAPRPLRRALPRASP